MTRMTGATTAIRTSSRRWLAGMAVVLGAAGLASCNGGEDFSDVVLPGCAFGAPCTETLAGNRLVELLGPRVANLRYRCVGRNSNAISSISHLRDEEVVTPAGVRVPPFTAVCPASAGQLQFFIGNALFESGVGGIGDFKVVGALFFPDLTEAQGLSPVQSVTLNDLVNSVRRVGLTDHRVHNRGLLLSALDSDTDGAVIRIPDELHALVASRYDDLIGNSDLDTSDDELFQAEFQPLLDALNEARDLDGFHEFPDDLDANGFNERLRAAMNLSRAGYYAMGYHDTQFGPLEFQNTIKRPKDNYQNLGRFSASVLVLPSGDVVGLGTTMISIDGGGTERENRRDAVLASGELGDELDVDISFTGLLETGTTNDTTLTLIGRVLGEVMFNGVPGALGEGKADIESFLPSNMPYEWDEADFGRLTGQFLGVFTEDMIVDEDEDAPGLPVRAARAARSVVQLDQDVLADLNGSRYFMTLKRGCEQDDEPEGVCEDDIQDEDREFYPQKYEWVESVDGSGGESSVELTFSFNREMTRRDGDLQGGAADTCLEIRHEDGNGIIYVGLGGLCPGDPSSSWPVGYVTRVTFDEDGQPESAGIAVFLAADSTDHTQLGTQIEGRIALQNCSRPLYRLLDSNFDDGIRASWVDNYLPVALQGEALDSNAEHDFEEDNEVNRRLFANVQGLVDFELDPASPGADAFTCE